MTRFRTTPHTAADVARARQILSGHPATTGWPQLVFLLTLTFAGVGFVLWRLGASVDADNWQQLRAGLGRVPWFVWPLLVVVIMPWLWAIVRVGTARLRARQPRPGMIDVGWRPSGIRWSQASRGTYRHDWRHLKAWAADDQIWTAQGGDGLLPLHLVVVLRDVDQAAVRKLRVISEQRILRDAPVEDRGFEVLQKPGANDE
jgi:hypothetical protein